MTREEYMEKLEKALDRFDDELKEDIINDYTEHFTIGLANGKSDEEVIEELGSIDELVDELDSLSGDEKKSASKTFEDIKKGIFEDNKIPETASDIMKGFATLLGTAAAAISKGTGKVVDGVTNGELKEGIEKAAKVVVDKSTEFAKTVSDSFKDSMGEDASEEGEPEEKKEVSFDQCEKIVVEGDVADVKVIASEDETNHFNYENHSGAKAALAYRFDYRQEGDTIIATVRKIAGRTEFFKEITNTDISLTVRVNSAVREICVRTKSGDVIVSDLALDKVKINTMSGDFTGMGVNFNKADISTMSGDAHVRSSKINELSFNTMSGDIVFDGDSDVIKFNTMSGDAVIDVLGKCNVNGKSMSGDMKINLKDSNGYSVVVTNPSYSTTLKFGEQVYKDAKNGRYTFGNGESEIALTTMSGDLHVS